MEQNNDILIDENAESTSTNKTEISAAQQKKAHQIIMSITIILLVLIFSIYGLCIKSRPLTKGVWADTRNYMFAVDVKGFDGDVYQPGMYSFEPSFSR